MALRVALFAVATIGPGTETAGHPNGLKASRMSTFGAISPFARGSIEMPSLRATAPWQRPPLATPRLGVSPFWKHTVRQISSMPDFGGEPEFDLAERAAKRKNKGKKYATGKKPKLIMPGKEFASDFGAPPPPPGGPGKAAEVDFNTPGIWGAAAPARGGPAQVDFNTPGVWGGAAPAAAGRGLDTSLGDRELTSGYVPGEDTILAGLDAKLGAGAQQKKSQSGDIATLGAMPTLTPLEDCPGAGETESESEIFQDADAAFSQYREERSLNTGAKCGKNLDRVCAQLLDEDGLPFEFGDYGDFWKLVRTTMTAADIRKNKGDSACISMLATAKIITNAGCDNVKINCKATDVNFVIPLFEEGNLGVSSFGVDIPATEECLKKKCQTSVMNLDSLSDDAGIWSKVRVTSFWSIVVAGCAASAIAAATVALQRRTRKVSGGEPFLE